jgi:hypothetical protein
MRREVKMSAHVDRVEGANEASKQKRQRPHTNGRGLKGLDGPIGWEDEADQVGDGGSEAQNVEVD